MGCAADSSWVSMQLHACCLLGGGDVHRQQSLPVVRDSSPSGLVNMHLHYQQVTVCALLCKADDMLVQGC